jgi:hypothetical protein
MIPHVSDPERRLAVLAVAVPDREATLRDRLHERRRGERRRDRDARDGRSACTLARQDAEGVTMFRAEVVHPGVRQLRHAPVSRPARRHPLRDDRGELYGGGVEEIDRGSVRRLVLRAVGVELDEVEVQAAPRGRPRGADERRRRSGEGQTRGKCQCLL